MKGPRVEIGGVIYFYLQNISLKSHSRVFILGYGIGEGEGEGEGEG